MFGKILIANRGEIALRILRTCREMGIRTVVAHSKADTNSLPVLLADESVCIGPEESAQSYLNIPSLISAAEVTDAEAIHPGYGFLAENAAFAEICRACSIRFIGPSPEAIRLLGDKVQARELARKTDVSLLPGSEGALRDEADARACAAEIGFPVLLKAAMGGGGRGMRIVRDPESLVASVQTCQKEAAAAFASSEIFVEKYVEGARHVEVQVLADAHGNLIHLGERECSIQRRYQKLLEESPSPAVTPAIRRALTAAALRLCRAAGYESAGTVEFVLDGEGRFYFLEMNTRIQVEHPVTEMVTGIDLVREQIRIAAGEPMSLTQETAACRGHAIECRITAEDPVTFTPNPGRISTYLPPGGLGVRVDSHCFGGYTIPPHYDSLVAKVIAHGADRAEAIARMRRALSEFLLEGIKTTIPFHARLLQDPRFVEGAYSTTFLETHI
ncbi:MAG: acetyl-CoA carboxylase biotin carboxylase subunit [Candidatus Rokubacteria bacterium]|nr:acetyl-CoA carboxylase biotin carboxylase subunit [Candidatus Rokubacteria bacterium]